MSSTHALAHPPGNTGEVRHYEGPPWLGFVADRQSKGVLKVGGVLRKSPASSAGLKPGDVLLEVAQIEVKRVRDLKVILNEHKVGDELDIRLKRDGKIIETTLTLAPTPTQKQLAKGQLMGEPAPSFTVPAVNVDGSSASHDLSKLEGKVTVIEFWATWCKPCEPFKKELEAVHKRHGEDVHILAISNEDEETLRAHMKESGLSYNVGADTTEAVHDAYFVRALPLVLVLDETHRVRKVITGDDDPALVGKSIQSLLKAK